MDLPMFMNITFLTLSIKIDKFKFCLILSNDVIGQLSQESCIWLEILMERTLNIEGEDRSGMGWRHKLKKITY